jgi:uncharacterized spore protein YtfJ
MDVKETISAAQNSLDARRVYGEPYEKNGVAVVPAAAVRGAGGAGTGESGEGTGGGSGFGLEAGRSGPT